MTFAEWKDSLTDEQRAEMETNVRILNNASADKGQYERYKSVLGTENVPKTFDKFQELKYYDSEAWTELKRLYRYENKPYLQQQLAYVMPTGEKNFIPDKAVITTVKTIAGNGSKTALRVEGQLISEYVGSVGEWKKRAGKIESKQYIFDVHWYELNGVQYRTKLKNRSDKK
ncbi:MAG: hypothetical protein LIO53_09395 [Oscillospiraceae bacterium]|nr:hypothetical protein [Oscillospiraceae bacterium]